MNSKPRQHWRLKAMSLIKNRMADESDPAEIGEMGSALSMLRPMEHINFEPTQPARKRKRKVGWSYSTKSRQGRGWRKVQ